MRLGFAAGVCILGCAVLARVSVSQAHSKEAQANETQPNASEPAPKLSLDLREGVKLELVLVPAGTFKQGSPETEAGRSADETQRKVTISQPFYLGIHPVTRGQFARFVAATKYRTEAEAGTSGGFGWDGKALVQKKQFNWRHPGFEQTDDHPVTLVTYPDAQAFLRWLTRASHRHCTLPSEAQWEYACRAGTKTPWYAEPPDDIAWFKATAGDGTRRVGQKAANAFGLFDTSGNVYEWCEDWFAPYPAGDATDPVQTDPNLSDKPRRVLRGGSWLKDAARVRSAARYRNDARSRNADNGFRVLAAIEPTTAAIDDSQKASNRPPRATPAVEPQTVPAPDVPAESSPSKVPLPHEPATPPHEVTFPEPVGPVAVQPQQDVASWIAPAILVAGALIVFFLVMRMFGRRGRDREMEEFNRLQHAGAAVRPQPGKRPGAAQPPPPPARGQAEPIRAVTSDGFWLGFLAGQIGSTVRYRYMVGGQPRIGEAVIGPDPQGTFVYTGDTPANVELLGIDPADEGGIPPGGFGLANPPRPTRSTPTHRPTPPKRSGFPSAY